MLPLGESATCTINNNDQAAQLTLVKTVTNDNGGTALPTAWTLGRGRSDADLRGDRVGAGDERAGRTRARYTLSESGGPAGYTAGAWSCTAGTLTGSIAGVAAGRVGDVHDQQQRPAGAVDVGEEGDERQRRHGGCDGVDVDGDGPTPIDRV